VSQMEHVVQQNASLVEEATAATESMKGQADSLLQTVSRFNLGGTVVGGSSRVEQPRRQPQRHAPVRAPLASAPINFKPAPQLTSDFASLTSTRARESGNGEWKEL
jgi:methyl-accepting chemotaxis protein